MSFLSHLLPRARRERAEREREEAYREYVETRYPLPPDELEPDEEAADEEEPWSPPESPPEATRNEDATPTGHTGVVPLDLAGPVAAIERADGPMGEPEVRSTRGGDGVDEGQPTPPETLSPGPPTPTVVRTGDQDAAAEEASVPGLTAPLPPPEGLEVRDGEVLRSLALCRIFSYAQIAALHFPGQLATARRRMRRLARAGWVTLFEERALRGGHPRYALPTTRALRWAFDAIAAEAAGTAQERLARELLRHQSREGLTLRSPGTPPFLPHQREIGNLVVTFRRCYRLGVTFAAALARPLPLTVDGVTMPQPDFVLLLAPFGRPPLLVLGEHDRGTEPAARFGRRKVEAYEQLVVQPALLSRLTGFTSFSVLITVTDPVHRRPMERLTTLAREIGKRGGDDTYALAPAGWVATAPDGPVWFTATLPPDPEIRRPNLELHTASGRTHTTLDVIGRRERARCAKCKT